MVASSSPPQHNPTKREATRLLVSPSPPVLAQITLYLCTNSFFSYFSFPFSSSSSPFTSHPNLLDSCKSLLTCHHTNPSSFISYSPSPVPGTFSSFFLNPPVKSTRLIRACLRGNTLISTASHDTTASAFRHPRALSSSDLQWPTLPTPPVRPLLPTAPTHRPPRIVRYVCPCAGPVTLLPCDFFPLLFFSHFHLLSLVLI